MCGLTILHGLPYFLLLVMPLYGSFFGKESILRLSLFLIGQNALSSTAAKYLLLAEPLVQTALVVLLVSMRVTLIPYWLVQFYDVLLFVSEPIWQVFETFGVVHVSMSLSQEAVDRIDDQPGLAKAYIIVVSGMCYMFSGWLLWTMFGGDNVKEVWACIGLVVIVFIVHICTVQHDSGVLSDAAAVCAASTAFLYDLLECKPDYTAEAAPVNWTRYASDHTYWQMTGQLIRSAPGASHAWAYFSLLTSPWFILTSLTRVCCVLFTISVAQHLVNRLTDRTKDGFDDDSDLDLEDVEQTSTLTLINSPLLIRVAVIFVFTQFMICHMYKSDLDSSWLSWLQSWFPSGRWAQIILINGAYLNQLYQVGSENDSF